MQYVRSILPLVLVSNSRLDFWQSKITLLNIRDATLSSEVGLFYCYELASCFNRCKRKENIECNNP